MSASGNLSVSVSKDVTVICRSCGRENAVTAWVLLSSADQPALVEQLSQGSLGTPCAQCHRLVEADLPVLVHRPEQGGTTVLAFGAASPAVASYQEASEVAEAMTAFLFAQLGIKGTGVEAYIVIVPRLALPSLLARDLRADIAVPPGQLELPADIAGSYRAVLTRLRERMGLA